MWQSIRVSLASVLFAALLPVTVWGYGLADYPGDRGGSAGGGHYAGALRLQTGVVEGGYYVRAWLDGLRPEDIHVYLERNRLVLQVAQGGRDELHDTNARGVSRWQMSFRRQLRLPRDADGTRMTMSMNNGILEIYIPARSRYLPVDPSGRW